MFVKQPAIYVAIVQTKGQPLSFSE